MTVQTDTDAPVPAGARRLVLSARHTAELPREPTGSDLERVFDAVGIRADNMVTLAFGLFAQAGGTINGERRALEELRHLLSARESYLLASWVNRGDDGEANPT